MNLPDQTGLRSSSSRPPHTPTSRPGQPTAGPAGPPPHGTAKAALEALDAELDQTIFATTLETSDGTAACLAIANKHSGLSEDIYCDGQSYWWPWKQQIAAVGNPQSAAAKISYVLGTGTARRG